MADGGILICNNYKGRLMRIEIGGRDEGGKFTDSGIEYELAYGEFQEVIVPSNGTVQIFLKDD